MRLTNIFLLILLIVISIGLGCKSFSRMFNKSGTEFIVEVETNEPNKDEIIQQAIKVTQNKLNTISVDGEVTQKPDAPNQISVKIYGSEDLEKLKNFLFTTYRLELKKVVSSPNPAPIQTYPDEDSAKKAATDEQEVLPYLDRDDYPAKDGDFPPKYIIVEKNPIIMGNDIRDAQAISRMGGTSDYQISFSLKPEGAAKFGDWTGKNIGNYLAVVLNKKVQSVPYIQGQIFDSGQIDGRFTKQSAEEIALSLKSGYLPADLKIIEEKPFGN